MYLSIIRRGEAYPSDIVEEMRAANLQILEGTLYPLLTRLKNAEMLTYRWVESHSGPPRKYFSLTEKGEAFYKELEQTWNELANGVNALAIKNQMNQSTNQFSLTEASFNQKIFDNEKDHQHKPERQGIPIEDSAYEKVAGVY